MFRITHLDSRNADGGEAVNFTLRPLYTSKKHFLLLVSVIGRVNRTDLIRLEGLSKSKKFSNLKGARTDDRPHWRGPHHDTIGTGGRCLTQHIILKNLFNSDC
jgi:hypothetical protein